MGKNDVLIGSHSRDTSKEDDKTHETKVNGISFKI